MGQTISPWIGDEAVTAAVKALKDIAADTGYETAHRVSAAQTLISFGIQNEFSSGQTEGSWDDCR